jgi:predicted HNH restriction endonuclease
LGRVVTDPESRADRENPYWVTPDEALEYRVNVAYRNPPGLPLWVGGPHDSIVKDLSVCRARGGTVFTIKPDQWNAILVAGDVQLEPTYDPDDAQERAINHLAAGGEVTSDPPGKQRPRRKRGVIGDRFERSVEVIASVLLKAGAHCELCGESVPFQRRKDSSAYLEVHHVQTLAEGGPDVVSNAVALCPNCHRRLHHGEDAEDCRERLYR